jgi:iron-sulfur cluster assembly accessory protein
LTGRAAYPTFNWHESTAQPAPWEVEPNMVQLTPQAVSKVKELLAAEQKEGFGLRVAIQGGGCSGFQYGLTFENTQRPTDEVIEVEGLKVYIDAMSQMYLQGVRIDYLETLQGAGFKIDNPNSTGTCGCGSSFTV